MFKIYYDHGETRIVKNGTDLWIWANVGVKINLVNKETQEESFLGVMTKKGLDDHLRRYYIDSEKSVEDYFISGRWMFDL